MVNLWPSEGPSLILLDTQPDAGTCQFKPGSQTRPFRHQWVARLLLPCDRPAGPHSTDSVTDTSHALVARCRARAALGLSHLYPHLVLGSEHFTPWVQSIFWCARKHNSGFR